MLGSKQKKTALAQGVTNAVEDAFDAICIMAMSAMTARENGVRREQIRGDTARYLQRFEAEISPGARKVFEQFRAAAEAAVALDCEILKPDEGPIGGSVAADSDLVSATSNAPDLAAA